MVRPQKYVSLEGQEDFLKKYLHLKLLKADIKEQHSVLGVICLHIFKMNNVKLRRSIYEKIISLKKVSPEMEPQPTTNETLVESMFDMGSTEMNTEMVNPKKVSSEMEPQPTTNETVESISDMGSTEMNPEMENPKKVSSEMEPQPTTNETLVEGMFDMDSTEMNTEMVNPKKVSFEMEPQPTTNETLVESISDMDSTEMHPEMENAKTVSSKMEPQPTTNETLVESMFDIGSTEMNPEMKNPKMADTPPKNTEHSYESKMELKKTNESDILDDSMLSKQSEVKDQFLQEFTVILEYMEWKKIRPLKGTHTLVKGSGWPSLLAEKFNQMIPGCVLSFKNHTVYNGSRGGYFRANAHCKHEGCGAFVFSMRKKPPKHSSAQILVTVTHPYKRHSRMAIKKRRLQGQQRKETQKRLRMSNPSKLYYEQLGSMDRKQFSSGNYTQPQSKEVLRKAKSEWNLAEVEHKDPFTELCIVASTLADCLPGKSNSLNLRGYVQTISYQPFSTILFSYESLMAAKNNIQKADGTFYFDATGGVAFLAGKSRRKLLYYALVQKGLNNSVVPVLQFLLENQTTVAIVNPLLLFFTALKKCTKHCSPKRVEMDFSWAIIHSVLQVLNCTTIHVYIKYCYMLITAKIPADTDTTVIHICSAHMVKTCRDYLRDKVPNKVIRQNAIKAFSLLQNCTQLTKMEDVWRMIVVVFSSRYKTKRVEESIKRFQEMPELVEDVSPNEDHGSPQVDEEEFLFIGRSSSGIRDTSPFKSHFKTIRDATEGEPLQESTSHLEENGYFQPVVLDILVDQYLPLACLWSGLMLNVDGQSTTKSSGETSAITRDSNAIVESWFNIVKSNLLCKKGGVRVGQFVKLVFTDVQGRLREYAGDSELERLKTTIEGVADARESWSKKRKPVKKGPHYYAANATAVPKQPKESKSGAQIKTSTPTEAECPDKIQATNLKLGTEEIPEKVIEKNIGECFTPLMTSTPKKKAKKKQYESSEGNGTQEIATSKKKSRKKLNDISEDNGTQYISTSKTKPRSSAANKNECLPVDKKRRRSQKPGTRLGMCVLPPGLKNTLNTCWLISTVQAFASLEGFNLKSSDPLCRELQLVMERIRDKDGNTELKDVKKVLLMNSKQDFPLGRQHDAADFVTWLLSLEPHPSPFHVEMSHIRECMECKEIHRMNEETNMLLFEMPQRSLLTVSLCIQEFCKTQILGRDDLVLCTSCNNRTWSIMSYEFEAVNSPFIMVQMKRFQRLGDRHSKVLSRVHLERILQKRIYELQGFADWNRETQLLQTCCNSDVTVLILPSGDVLLCDDFSVKKKPDNFIEQKMVQESCYLIYYEQLTVHNCYLDLDVKEDDAEDTFLGSIRRLDGNTFVAAHFNMMVNASDIKTLFDTNWLNDKVVYIYFRIIHASCSWISVVDPMFITALNEGRSSAAKKFLTPQHLQANQVLIPCVLEGHWTLIVLDVAGKTMTLVDSGNARDNGLTLVSHFFESMDEMPHSWTLQHSKEVSKQTNGYDCGVHMCQNAADVAYDLPFSCFPNKVHAIRKAMTFEILTGALMPRE